MSPELGGIEEKEVIKWHWLTWDKLMQDWGWKEEDDDLKSYDFVVDRRADELSFFTAERIIVSKLKIPLEEYTATPPALHSQQGEIWIEIQINPKDPYKPQLGIFSQKDIDFYYSEALIIYISNQGRAFEITTWDMILKPDAHEIQNPRRFSYLNGYPKPEEIQVKFILEPEPLMDNTEPFQPLKGESLERLDYLLENIY